MSKSKIESFLADETGAVTVDWVAITAILVLLVSVVIYNVSSGAENASISIKAALEAKGDALNP